ncbi:hypothetical protein CsSME_00050395 [Camellia sinensis var. sinensis]
MYLLGKVIDVISLYLYIFINQNISFWLIKKKGQFVSCVVCLQMMGVFIICFIKIKIYNVFNPCFRNMRSKIRNKRRTLLFKNLIESPILEQNCDALKNYIPIY